LPVDGPIEKDWEEDCLDGTISESQRIESSLVDTGISAIRAATNSSELVLDSIFAVWALLLLLLMLVVLLASKMSFLPLTFVPRGIFADMEVSRTLGKCDHI
jgi:hypothetical protein